MKCCYKCKETKDLTNFNKCNRSPDKHRSICKHCRSLEHKEKMKDPSEREKMRKFSSVYYANNKQKCIKAGNKWRKKNPEKVNVINERSKEKRLKTTKLWQKRNVDKVRLASKICTTKRRAAKLNATPKWLNKEQWDKIKEIYTNCPKGYHVDHIVPLQGKNVCGLHVPWNLQYLTPLENSKKKNKF